MVQGDGLRLGIADVRLLSGGGVGLPVGLFRLGRDGIIIRPIRTLILPLQHRAGSCVNFIAILHIAGLEFHLIDQDSVLLVQLHLHVINRVLLNAGVVQGDGLRLGVADVLHCCGRLGSGGLHRRRLRSVLHLALALQNRAGVGVELVLELLAALALDLHLIVCGGFVQLGIDRAVCHLGGRDLAKRRRGKVHGLVRADGHGGRARFGKVLELLHRELRQCVKLQGGVERQHTVHQRRLPGGNAVLPRLLLQSRVLRQRLRQDGRLRRAGLQNVIHRVRQLPLKLFRADGVFVLYRDHNGGGNTAEIAVSHQAAHNGVHSHVELCTLEVCSITHIRQDGFCILVERRTDEHLFAPIHLQLNAGVHIQ